MENPDSSTILPGKEDSKQTRRPTSVKASSRQRRIFDPPEADLRHKNKRIATRIIPAHRFLMLTRHQFPPYYSPGCLAHGWHFICPTHSQWRVRAGISPAYPAIKNKFQAILKTSLISHRPYCKIKRKFLTPMRFLIIFNTSLKGI